MGANSSDNYITILLIINQTINILLLYIIKYTLIIQVNEPMKPTLIGSVCALAYLHVSTVYSAIILINNADAYCDLGQTFQEETKSCVKDPNSILRELSDLGLELDIGQPILFASRPDSIANIFNSNEGSQLPGYEIQCLSSVQCEESQYCKAGQCLTDQSLEQQQVFPCRNTFCKLSQKCVFGKCIAPAQAQEQPNGNCGNKICSPGFSCKFGFCVRY